MKNNKKRIRVYPKKETVGWILIVPGKGRFQPSTIDEYLEIDVTQEEERRISKNTGVIIKEVK